MEKKCRVEQYKENVQKNGGIVSEHCIVFLVAPTKEIKMVGALSLFGLLMAIFGSERALVGHAFVLRPKTAVMAPPKRATKPLVQQQQQGLRPITVCSFMSDDDIPDESYWSESNLSSSQQHGGQRRQEEEEEPLFDHNDWVRYRGRRSDESESIATAMFGLFVLFLWAAALRM